MPTLTVALGTLAVATLVVLPAGIIQARRDAGLEADQSASSSSVSSVRRSRILYYELVSGAGASRAILNTYLAAGSAIMAWSSSARS